MTGAGGFVENIGLFLGYAGTATGLVTSVFYFRRAKKAEVQSKEIATADQMIELVKKANEEALKINREISENNRMEIEKLRKDIGRLQQAVMAIPTCTYRADCPVNERLQGYEGH